MKIAIVGCGPRGLSAALYILSYIDEVSIDIYDPDCLKTWSFPNLLDDIRMRSPITFDLVTNDPDMYRFSLSKFMNINLKPLPLNQSSLEALDHPVDRKSFIEYLHYIKDFLIKSGVNFIKETAHTITAFSVNNNKYDAVILSMGSSTKRVYPNWLRDEEVKYLVKPLSESHDIKNENILVVGSGQSAAEYVAYFSSNNIVHWMCNKELKIHNYPAPSYTEWKEHSALGKVFLNLKTKQEKKNYLRDVKQWGPSITPHTYSEIKYNKTSIRNLSYEGSRDIKAYIANNNISCILVAIGGQPDITRAPIGSAVLSEVNPYLPKVYPGYKMSNGIYVTGLIALDYGGPRQGSLVSTGDTSKEIALDIKNKYENV